MFLERLLCADTISFLKGEKEGKPLTLRILLTGISVKAPVGGAAAVGAAGVTGAASACMQREIQTAGFPNIVQT